MQQASSTAIRSARMRASGCCADEDWLNPLQLACNRFAEQLPVLLHPLLMMFFQYKNELTIGTGSWGGEGVLC